MPSIQQGLDRFLGLIDRERVIVFAAIGLGLCRGCLGWILALIRDGVAVPPGLPIPAHYLVGFGEIASFFLLAFYARKRVLVKQNGALFLLPLIAVTVGACLAAFSASGVGTGCGCVLVAMAFAVLFTLWLEFLSTLTPKKMLFSYCLGYFVNLAMWLSYKQMTLVFGTICCVLSVCVSLLLVAAAYRCTPEERVPQNVFPKELLSGRLLLWVLVFTFAYGIGDSITNMGFSTIVSKLGMALPELLVLLCLLFIPKRFEISIFYEMTFVLMLVGLMGAFITDEYLGASQVMMSAADECFQIFALMAACFIARQNNASSAMYCGLIMGCTNLFVRIGVLCGSVFSGSAELLYLVSLVLVLLSGVFLLRGTKLNEQLHLDSEMTPNVNDLYGLARDKDLSKREQTVFIMLVDGKGYEDISEELFIAPSTVRAHASRVYEKFGAHTRAEFEEAVQEARKK